MLASFTCETFLTSYSLLKVEYDWDLNNNNQYLGEKVAKMLHNFTINPPIKKEIEEKTNKGHAPVSYYKAQLHRIFEQSSVRQHSNEESIVSPQ